MRATVPYATASTPPPVRAGVLMLAPGAVAPFFRRAAGAVSSAVRRSPAHGVGTFPAEPKRLLECRARVPRGLSTLTWRREMDVFVPHPRPWHAIVDGDWLKIKAMNGSLVCILGYAQDAYIRAEADCIVAAVNAAVNPLDVTSDFISIPKAAWDDLADRAHDPTMAEGLAQSIREVDRNIKGAVSGSGWKP